MEDNYFKDINELNEEIIEGDKDVDQIHRAAVAATELDDMHDAVSSMESYNEQTDSIIRNAIGSIMRVASIGASDKAIADLQSFSQNPDLKTASLESIGETAVKIWEKIIAAIKSAIQWVKNIVKRLFGIQDKNEKRQEQIEKKIQTLSSKKDVPLFSFEYTPIMGYFVTPKLTVHTNSGFKKASASLSLLEKKSHEWLNNKGDSKFFTERIGIADSPTVNFAYGSESIGGNQILVQSLGEAPKTSDLKAIFQWVQTVRMGYTDHREASSSMYGKTYSVDLKNVDLMAILNALKEHNALMNASVEEMEKITAQAEKLVKQCERELDREGRESTSKKAMEAKTQILRATFLVTGPHMRYVSFGLKLNAAATSLVEQLAFKLF